MKVLQILGDSAFGGGSYQVLELSKFLQANGLSVTLLGTDKVTKKKFTEAGITVVSSALIKATVSPYKDILAILRLTKYLKRNKFDIVHTHTSKPGYIGRLAAHLAGVPLIIHTVHGYAFDDGYSFPRRFIFKYLEKQASRWSDLLITISNEIYQITIDQKISTAEKIVLIENGVDWQKFQKALESRSDIRNELGISDDKLLIGMISRLSLPKLPDDFVRAASNLKKQRINASYLIVGNGPLELKVAELIKELNMEKEFITLGFREDVPEILAAIDIFVLPTLWEGQSISLLEAMAAGKPIVTTDIAANREILENGKDALLVTIRNVEELTSAIAKLAENRQLANEIGKMAKSKVIESYSLDSSLKKILAAYNMKIKMTKNMDKQEATTFG